MRLLDAAIVARLHPLVPELWTCLCPQWWYDRHGCNHPKEYLGRDVSNLYYVSCLGLSRGKGTEWRQSVAAHSVGPGDPDIDEFVAVASLSEQEFRAMSRDWDCFDDSVEVPIFDGCEPRRVLGSVAVSCLALYLAGIQFGDCTDRGGIRAQYDIHWPSEYLAAYYARHGESVDWLRILQFLGRLGWICDECGD